MADAGHRGMEHGRWMAEAQALAAEALAAAEVPIGCVIVDPETREIVGRGRNMTNATRNPLRHAELEALTSAAAHYGPAVPWPRLELYVTIEPCVMCAAALRRAGIRRAYYGAANERFGGCGSVLGVHEMALCAEDAPLDAVALGGAHGRAAVEILRRFYLQQNDRAPVPRAKRGRVFRPCE